MAEKINRGFVSDKLLFANEFVEYYTKLYFPYCDTLKEAIESNCMLIAKESFEYCILKSRIVAVPSNIDLEDPEVDYTKFLTWENYYTDLLEKLVADTPLAYDKRHLNSRYTTKVNIQKVLTVYDPEHRIFPQQHKVQTTEFFS